MAALRSALPLTLSVGRHRKFIRAAAATAAQPERWQLWSAVCLERFPVITQQKTPMEKQFSELMQQIELEKSVLSNHELQHFTDLEKAAKLKQQDEEAAEDSQLQTAADFEDLWEERLRSFKPAGRTAAADVENNQKTVSRQLDRKLYFVVKQQLGNITPDHWMLPQGTWKQGESMRQAAERVLSTAVGNTGLTVQFLGNAPCGFIKYRYPQKAKADTSYDGAKVFFFKAQLLKGDVKMLPKQGVFVDHMWLTLDELRKHFHPGYFEKLKKFAVEF